MTSRTEARAQGLNTYTSGKPCRHGHVAPRRVRSTECIECERIRGRLGARGEKARARLKAWAKAHPDLVRATNRRTRGLPEPTRPEPATCECCGRPPMAGKALALDHDHETGAFRGWLCFFCNSGIGKLGDTVAGLRRALAYLEKS